MGGVDSKSTEAYITNSPPSYLKKINAVSCSPVAKEPALFGSEMAEMHIHLDQWNISEHSSWGKPDSFLKEEQSLTLAESFQSWDPGVLENESPVHVTVGSGAQGEADITRGSSLGLSEWPVCPTWKGRGSQSLPKPADEKFSSGKWWLHSLVWSHLVFQLAFIWLVIVTNLVWSLGSLAFAGPLFWMM